MELYREYANRAGTSLHAAFDAGLQRFQNYRPPAPRTVKRTA
jgi:hypothetical protein